MYKISFVIFPYMHRQATPVQSVEGGPRLYNRREGKNRRERPFFRDFARIRLCTFRRTLFLFSLLSLLYFFRFLLYQLVTMRDLAEPKTTTTTKGSGAEGGNVKFATPPHRNPLSFLVLYFSKRVLFFSPFLADRLLKRRGVPHHHSQKCICVKKE
jgi:hypothetical protein